MSRLKPRPTRRIHKVRPHTRACKFQPNQVVIWVERKHARSVPEIVGRSGRYEKRYMVVAGAFVAAARLLGGQRFALLLTN